MKVVSILSFILSLQLNAQQSQTDEIGKVYRQIILEHIGKADHVINETFTPIYKHDIDGNYEKWFYGRFAENSIVCMVPIRYESTVSAFLQTRNINFDTAGVFRQIDAVQMDSLSKYTTGGNILSCRKAPLGNSFLHNLFKKKNAVGLSPVYFDDANKLAFVKLEMYSKNKASVANPSKIIVLHKQGEEWITLGVLQKKI